MKEQLKHNMDIAYQEYCEATKAAFTNESDFYINKYASPELGEAFKVAQKKFMDARDLFNKHLED